MATNPVTDGVTTCRTVFDFVLDVWDRVLRGLCLWGVNKREEDRPDREPRDKLGEWADGRKMAVDDSNSQYSPRIILSAILRR